MSPEQNLVFALKNTLLFYIEGSEHREKGVPGWYVGKHSNNSLTDEAIPALLKKYKKELKLGNKKRSKGSILNHLLYLLSTMTLKGENVEAIRYGKTLASVRYRIRGMK